MKPLRVDARGFSLIEIMIVVAIIGITAAVVVPSVASRTRPFDMAREARQVHTEISRLRAKAVAEQRQYEVVISEGQTVVIRHDEERALDSKGLEGIVDGVVDAVDKVVDRSTDFASYATVEFNGESDGAVTFYPTGRVNGTGDLVISDENRSITVRILASGMTRMYVTSAGAAAP
jgi:prepilin-type N-terminal cleavage/methylation domain-containing protein